MFREIFPSEKEWYWCRKQQANTTIKKRVVFLSLLVWGKETPPFRGSVCFVLIRERRTRIQNEDDVVHNHHFLRVVFFPRSTEEDFDEKKIDSIFLDGIVFVIFRKR